MTTNEAFAKMIATKGMAKKLGLSDSTFGSVKNAFKTGNKKVSLDKKIELLQRAGYAIKQDIVWMEVPIFKCPACFKEIVEIKDGQAKCPDCDSEWVRHLIV